MNDEVFLDTSYAIALSSPKDSHHSEATRLADELGVSGVYLVTTQAILLEIGNALSKLRHRQAAIQLLHSLVTDASVEIVPFSEELFSRAMQLYIGRPDKEWGLTDCISFVVMTDRRITNALTTDAHFQQAGFQALMARQ